MKSYYLKCYLCGKKHEETESVTECIECWWPIETYYDYDLIFSKINKHILKTAPCAAMKYIPFYPINDYNNIISLEEGGTPLIKADNLWNRLWLKNLYLKNEGVNPTWCFKDRWTLVEVSKAKELWAQAICLASTWNMAASVAAYSSAAWIPCYVLVPEGTPIWKLSQTLTFGARVIQIRSWYSECARLAKQMASHFGYYLAWDYTFRVEWQKSQGYEIVEQLFWKSPDYVVCPIWCGTNFHAIYKWIKEYYNLWLIDRLPKLIWVQVVTSNPITKAFKDGRRDFDIQKNPYTVAWAMCVWDPLDWEKILADIYESWGICTDVTDEFLLECQQELARNAWVFAEPSWVLSYAAVKSLAQENFFDSNDTIVCIVNWNGLKDPKSPLKLLPEPASIEPDFAEIERFISQKLYLINEAGVKERSKLIFTRIPDHQELLNEIKKHFGITASGELLALIEREIVAFIEKGKHIQKSDLQFILEESLNEIYLQHKALEILDFTIVTSLHSKAKATISAKIDWKVINMEWEWVGPVDAAIRSLKSWLVFEVNLVDYEVEIDSKGVDSTVSVKMTVVDKFWNKVVAICSSPDIVAWSIRAFEKWFNLLSWKQKNI